MISMLEMVQSSQTEVKTSKSTNCRNGNIWHDFESVNEKWFQKLLEWWNGFKTSATLSNFCDRYEFQMDRPTNHQDWSFFLKNYFVTVITTT